MASHDVLRDVIQGASSYPAGSPDYTNVQHKASVGARIPRISKICGWPLHDRNTMCYTHACAVRLYSNRWLAAARLSKQSQVLSRQ